MSFISVLFALLLDQARPLGRGNPIHAAMRSWVGYCSRNLDAGKPLHGWLAWGLAVGLPSGLALLIYWALTLWVGPPLAVLWSALVLYASLGFRQFSFHFTEIRDALANDDDALARSLLAQWQHLDTQSWSRSEIIGRVIGCAGIGPHGSGAVPPGRICCPLLAAQKSGHGTTCKPGPAKQCKDRLALD